MSYNNYYGNGRSSGGFGGFGGGYGGRDSGRGFGGRNHYGGYGAFSERPVYFPSDLRRDMYKSSGFGRYSNQEERRRSLLNEQRDRRSGAHNRGRKFGQPPRNKKPFNKSAGPPKPREYKDILSYSEYLVERPDDLEQWVVVACPKGKRCTLVAHKGITTMYDKLGKPIDSFNSHLPGGCDSLQLMATHGGMRKTILDCIYSEADKTFYVLDIIMWNMHPFVECETSLRFFWLQTRLEETDIASVSKTNSYRVLPAVRFNVIDSQQHLLQAALYPDNKPVVDGFLFYHPEAIYMSGTTPLVGWLKGYMIPDIIGHLQLHPLYVEEKPADYTTLVEYVEKHGNTYGKKKKKNKGDKEEKTDKADKEDKMELETDVLTASAKLETETAMED